MIGAAIVVFREVLEAGLIVGIMLAVTRGVAGSRIAISVGIAGGLLGATLIAVFAGAIASAVEGIGQELLNATILALAVVMLAWHTIWMAQHGREMAREMRSLGADVREGKRTLPALTLVVAIAVMREGSEVVLFLYGLAASRGERALDIILGSLGGLLAGAGVSLITFLGLVTIPARYLFSVTSGLITLLAAGLAAQSIGFLQQAGVVTSLAASAWDTSAILSETDLPGRILHTLIGYSDQPSQLQVITYVITLVGILGLARLVRAGDVRPD
jgi:high-affinity iron transporter